MITGITALIGLTAAIGKGDRCFLLMSDALHGRRPDARVSVVCGGPVEG